jgi:hypothetical protein
MADNIAGIAPLPDALGKVADYPNEVNAQSERYKVGVEVIPELRCVRFTLVHKTISELKPTHVYVGFDALLKTAGAMLTGLDFNVVGP